MAKKSTLPLIESSGKPYEFGKTIGRKCASRAIAYRKSIAAAIEHSTGMKWPRAVEQARLYLPYAEDFYPYYVDEIRGYSEGAKMPFEEAFALTCHELLSSSGFRGCTDIAVNMDVTAEGNVIAAHNEDWSTDAAGTVVFLHGKPSKKPAFLATCYAGLFPSCGMNSSGISSTGNALDPNDVRIGIPKIFPAKKVLEARRIGDALSAAMPADRASSYNNIVSDKNGEIYSLEGSATDCAWLYAAGGYLVHTNHYISTKMRRFESSPNDIGCSIFRLNRAQRLLEEQLGAVTVESLKTILSDHVNKPCSVCRHSDPRVHPLDVSETIFSVIYDLTKLEAHVLKGKPCSAEYARFSLRE